VSTLWPDYQSTYFCLEFQIHWHRFSFKQEYKCFLLDFSANRLPVLPIRLFNCWCNRVRLCLSCCNGVSDLLITSSANLFICRDRVPFEFKRLANLSVCNDLLSTDQDQAFRTEPV